MAEATPAQIRALEVLEKRLWNDAKLGPEVQRIIKEMYPDAKTNADIVDPWVAPLREDNARLARQLDELRASLAADKKAAEEGATRQSLEQALDSARKAYSLTDEGFDKMVARMKETSNYSDAEAAAAWVASKTPPAQPAGPTWAPQSMNLFGSKKYDEAFKELHSDPERYMDSQLAEFVRDPDRYTAESNRAA